MEPLNYIERELGKNSSEAVKTSTKHFFKEEIHTLGVKSVQVKRIARDVLALLRNSPRERVFDLCETLWQSGYLEKCGLACELAYAMKKLYVPGDFGMFERWVDNYVSNWANCDSLCNHSVGSFVEMYPEFLDKLKLWTKSLNRWKKRAAAVSLIIPARRGLVPSVDILAIADALLTDGDDMVQKGYGWLLKATSEAHRDEIFNYVVTKKNIMPRIALRYAIEKMPQEMRKLAMEH
ncbi:MAG: DNA alkylation repair protein [Rickettsiales bacterium]|jgi:3-methyladenine DNA glycosylase AlkD|nr:DNA alkylation repair protein [Rickettsiales bacterium]